MLESSNMTTPATRKKTTAKTVYLFVLASILVILGLAYLFKPPPRSKVAPASTREPTSSAGTDQH